MSSHRPIHSFSFLLSRRLAPSMVEDTFSAWVLFYVDYTRLPLLIEEEISETH